MNEKNEMQRQERKAKASFLRKLFSKGRARAVAMVMALASLMSLSAFAADGETTSGAGFDAVIGSIDTLGTLMNKVWILMTGNALLTLFLAVALLGVGVSVFRMIKRAAHR